MRVVDDVFHERNFQQSATTSGELVKMRIPLPCDSGLPFHVSATDSRTGPGPLGVVFSNTVTFALSLIGGSQVSSDCVFFENLPQFRESSAGAH